MVIRIMYKDNRYDMVKAFRLDDLLAQGKITMFRRSSGWVFVGIDPIRTFSHYLYRNYERRRDLEGQG